MSDRAKLRWWVVLGEQPSTTPGAVARQGWVLVCAETSERAVELGGRRLAHLVGDLGPGRVDHRRLRLTCGELHDRPAPQQRRERVIGELPRSDRAWFSPRPHLYPWRLLDAAGNVHDYP